MKNQHFKFALFLLGFFLVLFLREYFKEYLLEEGINSYSIHKLLGIGMNVLLILLALVFIKFENLHNYLKHLPSQVSAKSALIPLLYVLFLNIAFVELSESTSILTLTLFFIYVISVGLAEELTIRGGMLCYMLKYHGYTRTRQIVIVWLVALFFGALHFIKFSKGIAGELVQLYYATIIGVLFGLWMLKTKRLFPLIIVHTSIDFFGDLDVVGIPVVLSDKSNAMSLEEALAVFVVFIPCILYILYLLKPSRSRE